MMFFILILLIIILLFELVKAKKALLRFDERDRRYKNLACEHSRRQNDLGVDADPC